MRRLALLALALPVLATGCADAGSDPSGTLDNRLAHKIQPGMKRADLGLSAPLDSYRGCGYYRGLRLHGVYIEATGAVWRICFRRSGVVRSNTPLCPVPLRPGEKARYVKAQYDINTARCRD
jgi:hypothetical protein